MKTLACKVLAATILTMFLTQAVCGAVKDADFGSVVKMIEQFYRVKHQGIPFLANAGIKAGRTAARIKGGAAKQLAEAGSAKVAVFENQNFAGDFIKFRTSLNQTMVASWTPLLQALSAPNEEQTYIFLRDVGDKFHVLVVTIGQRDATVVQVTLSPKNLAALMRDPEGAGKAITEEATINDPE